MFLAKSAPLKTIQEHTRETLECFENFLTLYGKYFQEDEIEAIRYAIAVHDIGKVNSLFQEKIHKSAGIDYKIDKNIKQAYKKEIPHGFISAMMINMKELEKRVGRDLSRAVRDAVYYHHDREDSFVGNDFLTAKNYDLQHQIQKFNQEAQTSYTPKAQINKYIKNSAELPSEDYLCKYLFIKGMLNKMDYYASGYSDFEVEIPAVNQGKYLYNIIEEQYTNLREVQLYMKENKDKNLVVIASTGMGKTEGAILWLEQSKGFYTLPLKVSINAIYERIIQKYKWNKEKLSLLHSDALAYLLSQKDKDTEDENEIFIKNMKARLLSFPLTICTADQIFKFVFKHFGDEIIPATLKYSKLVIDEIQMYTPEIVAFMIYGLKIITKLGGKFLIMTATFPPVFKHLMMENHLECIFSKPFESHIKRRHFIQYREEDFDYADIAEKAKTKKVLVLCNTVKKAQEVYKRLFDDNTVWLLHSNFIKRDRKIVEDKIIEFAKSENQSGIWVSTQIVEASLDIDFDILYTEMCTADSLLQRLGRCYRNREYIENDPNVFIFNNENGKGTVYDKDIFDLSCKYIKQYSNGVFWEKDKYEYIDNVFDTENVKKYAKKYYKTINDALTNISNVLPGELEKKQITELFRKIQNIDVIPDKVYEEILNNGEYERLEELINSKQTSKNDRIKAINELFQYTVSIRNTKEGYGKKIHDNVKLSINNVNIYRTQCQYLFDIENKTKSLGLDLSRQEISNYI